MVIRSDSDAKKLRTGGALLGGILRDLAGMVAPGVRTIELDRRAEEMIRAAGGKPSFKGYKTYGTKMPYPASVCISVNDEVVHGIPGERELEEGDIVGLDIGMEYKGFFTDTAVTVGVGKVSDDRQKLMDAARDALEIGIQAAKAGGYTGDIGEAIQLFVEKRRYGLIRELVGHGVGDAVHEEPEVPNWGQRGTGVRLAEGMVLALEPMITLGSRELKNDATGWVWLTKDGKPAAHFEHTIIVTRGGAEVVTRV